METDKRKCIDHMAYMEGMEKIDSDIPDRVLDQRNRYQPESYTAQDVRNALNHENRSMEDFAALLSPAAAPFLEEMAGKAKQETEKHFGNSVYPFTFPITVKITVCIVGLTVITGFTG